MGKKRRIVERIEKLKEIIREKGKVDIPYLADALKVTPMTIYNYLNKLEDTDGSRFIVSKKNVIFVDDVNKFFKAYDYRRQLEYNKVKKRQIAAKAVGFIKNFDTIYLDNSTTVHYLVNEIIRHRPNHLTVVTNSPIVVLELYELFKDGYTIYCVGEKIHKMGGVFHSDEYPLFGELNINKAFISAYGITKENGFTELLEEEAKIKRKLLEHVKNIYVLADDDKFGIMGPHTYGDIGIASRIIINDNVNMKKIKDELENKIEVI